MKNYLRIFAILIFAVSFTVSAQTEDNPWGITVGLNAVDFHPANNKGDITNGGNESGWFNEFANVEHYNIVPFSYIEIGKYISNNVTVDLHGSFNQLKVYRNKMKIDDVEVGSNGDKMFYYNIGLGANYMFLKNKKINPYARLVAGHEWIGKENKSPAAGAGAGFNFQLSENFMLKLQSTARFDLNSENTLDHFQHSLAFNVSIGGTDTDGDGVLDKYDDCPEVSGVKDLNGCPDKDADGIADKDDACPNTFGTIEFNGCNDTDADGIADNKDACPDVAGTAEFNGCADGDSDGVADNLDECPEEAGDKENKGCPWPDTDGDGVVDKDDKCPSEAGIAEEGGCPAKPVEPNTDVLKKLNDYAKTILFNSGKSTFINETIPVLNAMKDIFVEYPNASFNLDGHTDSVGSSTLNQRLSESRANAVKDWLVQNGINAARLNARGFGENNPISSNKTSSGRKQNRRVEVTLAK